MTQEIFEAANRHDIDALMALYRDDIVMERIPGGVFRGKQAVRDYWAATFASMPDLQLELLNLTTADDVAVVEWRARGTFSGTPSLGIHATGKAVDFRGCDVNRFADGLLAQETAYMDALSWSRQVGALPSEGSLADKAMVTAFNAQTDLVKAIREWRENRK